MGRPAVRPERFPRRGRRAGAIAAQEFGSDATDPYGVQAVGLGLEALGVKGFRLQLDGSLERQRPLAVRATPATGRFTPILPATPLRAVRLSLTAERPTALSVFGTELRLRGELRATRISTDDAAFQVPTSTVGRAFASLSIERPFTSGRLVLFTAGGAVGANGPIPAQEWLYFGGPVSAPGYAYHELAAVAGGARRRSRRSFKPPTRGARWRPMSRIRPVSIRAWEPRCSLSSTSCA